MAIQCADVETLVQTHLDDELADEDARVLKEHLTSCRSCGVLASEEARFHAELRSKLAAPAMPAELAGRIAAELDRHDWRARKERVGRLSAVLPMAASLAAAAALLLFVVSTRDGGSEPQLAQEAVRQHMRRPPIEVQGTAVSPWVERHMSPHVQIPTFSQSTQLRGARLSHLRGRDAAQVFYDAFIGHRRHEVSAMIVPDAMDLKLRGGQRHVVDGRELWVGASHGYSVVFHKAVNGTVYLFTSDMDAGELLDLVADSDLLMRAGGRGGW